MSTHTTWQKSSYSSEGSACLEMRSATTSALLLRESDEPETVLSTTPQRVTGLLRLAARATV